MEEITDAERFLMFVNLLASNSPGKPTTPQKGIKYFAKMLGWDENRARSAYEVGIIKGWFSSPE